MSSARVRDDLLTLHVDGTEGIAMADLRDCKMLHRGAKPKPVWNLEGNQIPPPAEHPRAQLLRLGNQLLQCVHKPLPIQRQLMISQISPGEDPPLRIEQNLGGKTSAAEVLLNDIRSQGLPLPWWVGGRNCRLPQAALFLFSFCTWIDIV
jgi:hypothetical protein